ncbi:hypothetical protein V1525DRAFT_395636 [Lipomyces kononenkoae]|uniref:Uncharacterized protein n=1 Tax=Lipomyces kononenkoae TaxID=34357 RepID=A0ACC3T8Q9_LIPKO
MVSATELEAIRQDYITSLDDLTFNSRPIITNLTIIAQENIQAAEVITRAIEEHISKCAPSSKLPALYLLDSICKNVGSPYTLLFGRNLYRTFTDAYTLVNDGIRRKMHELFQTWKQPSVTTGQILFNQEPLRRIENYLMKAQTALVEFQQLDHRQRRPSPSAYAQGYLQQVPTPPQQHVTPSHSSAYTYAQVTPSYTQTTSVADASYRRQDSDYTPPPAGQPNVTTGSLLAEISSLIQFTSDKLYDNPADPDLKTQLSALSQLHSILLGSNLPASQLATIKSRLDVLSSELHQTKKRKAETESLVSPAPKRAWNLPSAVNESAVPVWISPQPQPPASQPPAPLTQAFMPPAISSVHAPSIQPDLLASVVQALAQPQFGAALGTSLASSIPPAHAPAAPTMADPSAIFASLKAAGLLSPDATATAGSNGLEKQISDIFSKVLSPDIELSNKFLQTSRPDLAGLLYDLLPVQCSTCGRRFADTERDRKIRDAHLDWHFRVNKRLREDTRGQSRSWYLDEESWIKFTDGDDSNESGGATDTSFESNANGSTDSKRKREDVSSKYIPAPKDPNVINTPCPICKEKFKSVWNESAEDWVWMNAVKAENGKIYHATCLQDAENITL